ncbi:MAG: hypothetical protein WA949_09050, partial [Phormidesmis sp.]
MSTGKINDGLFKKEAHLGKTYLSETHSHSFMCIDHAKKDMHKKDLILISYPFTPSLTEQSMTIATSATV